MVISRRRIRVDWGHCDPAGIVFYPNYFRWFDQCTSALFESAGLPLPPAARHSDAVMKNLVGPDEAALWPEILGTPGLIPHLYGKAEARPGRKMGHVTRVKAEK